MAELPDYAPMLTAYHRAFAAELEAMVGSLPIDEGSRVLEMACGDGAYTPWLASKVGDTGEVVGLDLSAAYLGIAREATRGDDRVRFVVGSIDRLPFADGAFDVAWCAQSLFSLPEPVEAVQKMARVVRPGGLVAVLEDDTMHQVLLPWPVDVELAVWAAEWRALNEEFDEPRKFYVGRRLVRVFLEAGLVAPTIRTYATDRVAPIEGDARTFLEEYLAELRERVGPRLDHKIRAEFERLVDPDSPDAMLGRPDLAVTWIDHVVCGRKPS